MECQNTKVIKVKSKKREKKTDRSQQVGQKYVTKPVEG